MTNWHTWLIEPHDPLIARDGRPFNNTPGARATSLPFPVPTTVAGATRTLAGSDPNTGHFTAQPEDVRKWAMRGPLLVELHGVTPDITWLLPAPADALLLTHADSNLALRKQLVPLTNAQATSDLESDLCLIGTRDYDPAKPLANPPTYWRWEQLWGWLHAAKHADKDVTISALGHRGPVAEGRIHVGIDQATQTASEGMLFQTRGLEFTHRERDASLQQAVRMALALASDAPLRAAIAPVGGERRLARWQKVNAPLPGNNEQIATISTAIATAGGCRVLLLTPALFNGGFRPNTQSYLMQPLVGTNIQITLRGVAIGRAQVLSGWDMEQGGPKPTRRFVPAGTVLFLNVQGDSTAIQNWVEDHWMHCVSDGEQERRDGFGLAVFGAWSGEPEAIIWGQSHAKTADSTTTKSHS